MPALSGGRLPPVGSSVIAHRHSFVGFLPHAAVTVFSEAPRRRAAARAVPLLSKAARGTERSSSGRWTWSVAGKARLETVTCGASWRRADVPGNLWDGSAGGGGGSRGRRWVLRLGDLTWVALPEGVSQALSWAEHHLANGGRPSEANSVVLRLVSAVFRPDADPTRLLDMIFVGCLFFCLLSTSAPP